MTINISIEFGLKNGEVKRVVLKEEDPKGILRDKTTGEEREIELTGKEVQMEYTKRISSNIEEGKTLFFRDIDDLVILINPTEIASVEVKLVGDK